MLCSSIIWSGTLSGVTNMIYWNMYIWGYCNKINKNWILWGISFRLSWVVQESVDNLRGERFLKISFDHISFVSEHNASMQRYISYTKKHLQMHLASGKPTIYLRNIKIVLFSTFIIVTSTMHSYNIARGTKIMILFMIRVKYAN